VTNASSANFVFNGYSHILGRELDTDFCNIAKGGTGIASSFVGPNALISNFYNNLTYQNVFNPADGTKYNMSHLDAMGRISVDPIRRNRLFSHPS
jgi:hypothetical protein